MLQKAGFLTGYLLSFLVTVHGFRGSGFKGSEVQGSEVQGSEVDGFRGRKGQRTLCGKKNRARAQHRGARNQTEKEDVRP